MRRTVSGSVRTALATVLSVAALAGTASAHVKYVTPGARPASVARFLAEALTDPTTLLALAGGALVVLTAALFYLRVRPARRDVDAFRAAMTDYRDLLPWLLRLSVGLPLVGAGFAGYLFSPIVRPPAPTAVRLFGIAVGFALLFGLATRAVAATGLVTYLLALPVYPALVLAFEYVPGLLAVALVGGGRPSADAVLARLAADERTLFSRVDPVYRSVAVPLAERVEPYRAYVPTVVRVGLGFTFVYLGVAEKLLAPGDALAVVAKYDLTAVVPVAPELWVVGAAVVEIALGVALVVGAFVRAGSLVAIAMFTTTLFGLPDDPVLAHVSLFGLVSVLLITGAGPWSVDTRLGDASTERNREDRRDALDADECADEGGEGGEVPADD